MKDKNGITLIALIITIIVMIILVGVTINIVLNGGLFGTTNEAAMQQEKQSILEKIIGMSEYTEDGYIDVAGTYNNVNASELNIVGATRTRFFKLLINNRRKIWII